MLEKKLSENQIKRIKEIEKQWMEEAALIKDVPSKGIFDNESNKPYSELIKKYMPGIEKIKNE